MIKTTEQKIFKGAIDVSILDSAINADLNFEYSCRTGQCGVCKTNLLGGQVVELQEQIALSDKDRLSNKILTCCCAPINDILIDSQDLSELKGIKIKTIPARIKNIKKYTKDILEVNLKIPPSSDFKFIEGQYLDVIKGDIKRSYSIASSKHNNEIKLIIRRYDGGLMSDYWFNQACENDLLRIEGPKGTFFLRNKSAPIIFLATGTGIAPIMSILSSLDENINYNQKNTIEVYWGNRYVEDFIWQPKFKKINVSFNKVCSRPQSDWQGEKGYVQDVAIQNFSSGCSYNVYACGSNSMIQSAHEIFIHKGLEEQNFYSDAFVKSF